MKRFITASAVAALTIAASTACATKKYVQTTVDDVPEEVLSLNNAVEETQEQTRKNDARITEVDTNVQAVRQTALQAKQTAMQAAEVAKTVETRTAAIERSARSAGHVVNEIVLSQDGVTFGFEETDVSDAAKHELAALVEALKRETNSVLIVLEGHTDSTGPKTVNKTIGLERAEAVKRYLYEQHHIPLPVMDVISYGEDKPVAPNATKEGRAQNRRVVIKVMR